MIITAGRPGEQPCWSEPWTTFSARTIETIADLVGHKGTSVTERVYRHQLKPVITKGATTMNTIFAERKDTESG